MQLATQQLARYATQNATYKTNTPLDVLSSAHVDTMHLLIWVHLEANLLIHIPRI